MNFLKKFFKSTNFALNNTSCHCEITKSPLQRDPAVAGQSRLDFVIRSGLPRGKAPRNDTIARDGNMAKFKNKKELWLLISIIIIGAFLRFWNIGKFQYLTYDQSRDYIIIKRIIVDKKFTLVGPTVSIAPGVFLPPFYYYSLAPFLFLFKFHIIGPDIYTALLGTISIYVFYLLAKDLFETNSSLLATFIYAANPYLIQTTRHAWNPNTLPLFVLLFLLSFERYIFNNKRKYILLAGFSLGWAIGLHLNAVIFLPLLIFLFYQEIKKFKINKLLFFSVTLFLLIFLPLVFFELRHNFIITKACISFLFFQKENGSIINTLLPRLFYLLKDIINAPLILLTGLFQEQNLTIRPSNISVFYGIQFSKLSILDTFKIIIASFVWVFSIFGLIKSKNNKSKMILVFIFFGFLSRLFFPVNLFYFYYYLCLFPIIFLSITQIIVILMRQKNLFLKRTSTIFILIFAVSGLFFKKFNLEDKSEKYFLPSVKVIADNYIPGKKVAIASIPQDTTRWEKNGLEYRYFLEAFYRLPIGNWEEIDYKSSDILYLVDEGDIKEPLKLKGMEMDNFSPKKIEKTWQIETGQKVYKLTN